MSVIKYDLMPGTHIERAAEEMFSLCVYHGGKRIEADFNGIPIWAEAGDTAEQISARWQTEMNRQREEYLASPAYAQQKAESEQRQQRKDQQFRDAIADAPKGFRNVNAVLWQDQIINNKDPYGARIVQYADEWARIMEVRIEKGETVEQCADECSHIADYDGITGFMYGAAVAILAQCWEYGDALRKWHNKQWGVPETEAGTANPALWTITTKGGTQ